MRVCILDMHDYIYIYILSMMHTLLQQVSILYKYTTYYSILIIHNTREYTSQYIYNIRAYYVMNTTHVCVQCMHRLYNAYYYEQSSSMYVYCILSCSMHTVCIIYVLRASQYIILCILCIVLALRTRVLIIASMHTTTSQ